MKPKYKRRLILSLLVLFALFVGLLYLISFGVRAIRVQLNTTKLPNVTASTVLEKSSMNQILEIMKQSEAGNVLVVDSELTMNGEGKVTGLTMHLVNLVSQSSAENWRLTANEKKAKLWKQEVRNESRNVLRMSKVEFKTYYPALSRVTSPQLIDYFTNNFPVGAKGRYTFTDSFVNNLEPEIDSSLAAGMDGVWVSRIGGVTGGLQEGYQRPTDCAPMVVTAEAVNTEKSKGRKVVLREPEELLLVMLEAAPY